jgi:type IV secretion system protein VirB1
MADLATLILQCSIAVHPQTAQAVVQYESHGNQYALNTQVRSYYPRSREEAAARLEQALRAGLSTDIGLMQVNSQWLRRLRLPADALLDPCTNVRVGTAILSRNYAHTWAKYRAQKPALLTALSLYNTGNETRGLRNGYVAKVVALAGVPVRFGAGVGRGTQESSMFAPTRDPRMAPTGFTGTGPITKTPAL